MRRFCLLFLIALLSSTASAEQVNPEKDDTIRISRDGAGPSHIFWVGRRSGSTTDIVGIIDPLYAAVRFFSVVPAADASDGGRIQSAGVCGLPVDLRPWRVHQNKQAVIIETMPVVGVAAQNSSPKVVTTRMYSIPRKIVEKPASTFTDAAEGILTREWDPATVVPCGSWDGPDGSPGAKIGLVAVRGAHNPNRTIILANGPDALAPRQDLIVRARSSSPNRLMSARELEPTATRRIVLLSEGIGSADGLLRIQQRLLIFARDSRALIGEMSFDDTFLRSKLGARPIAVLPTGEVIAMGKYNASGETSFRLMSCGSILNAAAKSQICAHVDEDLKYRQTPDTTTVENPSLPEIDTPELRAEALSARQIFENVRPLTEYKLRVDTTYLPADCRLAQGCFTGQTNGGKPVNFVPIRGIRLTRGIFERTGVPYAQANIPSDLDAILTASQQQLTVALANVQNGAHGLPGNLSDNWSYDLGVDCSGLVQVAWGAKNRPHRDPNGKVINRLTTEEIQLLHDKLLCTSRLPGPEFLKAGDIIAVNVSDGLNHITNHVMIYAATLHFEQGNDAWLMLESSSSCDGVCWSVYDPSFFNGWGMYRAAGRSDAPCPRASAIRSLPIPFEYNEWVAQIRRPILLSEMKD